MASTTNDVIFEINRLIGDDTNNLVLGAVAVFAAEAGAVLRLVARTDFGRGDCKITCCLALALILNVVSMGAGALAKSLLIGMTLELAKQGGTWIFDEHVEMLNALQTWTFFANFLVLGVAFCVAPKAFAKIMKPVE